MKMIKVRSNKLIAYFVLLVATMISNIAKSLAKQMLETLNDIMTEELRNRVGIRAVPNDDCTIQAIYDLASTKNYSPHFSPQAYCGCSIIR